MSINDGLYVGETARSIGERIGENLIKHGVKEKTQFFTSTLKGRMGVEGKT